MRKVIEKTRSIQVFSLLLLVIINLSSCDLIFETPPSQDDLVEEAVQTLQAQATQSMFETLVAQLTLAAQPTNTATATLVPTSTDTPVPTFTPTITATYTPTNTPTKTATNTPTKTATKVPPTKTPTPTATPIPCNIGKFIKDITVPDNTEMRPGESFIKIWRIQNVGSCTWSTAYDIVFVSGSLMGAKKAYDMTTNVKPGETIDISVSMTAPSEGGNYTGYWMLRNQYGARFGVGEKGETPFWVKIKVEEDLKEVYRFAVDMCEAEWTSGSENGVLELPCPGKETSIKTGYVLSKDHPYREDGYRENEIGLITRPNNSKGGYIQGVFPAYTVKSGDKFKAAINCEYDSKNCDVYFELRYINDKGVVKVLGRWHEIYEGKWNNITVDLKSLVGAKVKFILYVENGFTQKDNKALWIRPSIWR